jgi:hypothetical protein
VRAAVSAARPDIATRAYTLWQEAGSPAGRDMEFWLRAEAETRRPAK